MISELLQDVKPDVVTYTTLMKALIRVEKFEKVYNLSQNLMVLSSPLVAISWPVVPNQS